MTFEILAFVVALVVVLGAATYVIKSTKRKDQRVAQRQEIPESVVVDMPPLELEDDRIIPVDLKERPLNQTPIDSPEKLKTFNEEPITEIGQQETRLEDALANTKGSLWGRIQGLFGAGNKFDVEAVEEILYTSDIGPSTVQRLMDSLNENLSGSDFSDQEKLKNTLKTEMLRMLKDTQGEDEEQLAGLEYELLNEDDSEVKPVVWMIIGVNGAGKTTTIGKLANILANDGKKVMLAAGDTFRAAADAQLKVWSERADVELFSPEGVKDPSAVAFDAAKKAQSKGFDHLIVDTAGRLHTQNNLMEELKKMKRVIDKALPEAPHEMLLVLDANNGQNALIQAREFNRALDLTGVILTKMDGSAKGGVVLGVANELQLPIKRIGVGEKIEDLRAFNSKDFVEAIF
ncbi:MAG: signal recognition particle-docking protein FtsY [Bdellovibrionales bacterium]